MAKSKQLSSKPAAFAKGGSNKMFGKQSAGPQKSGQTAQAGSSSAKFAAGGKGKMFGKQTAAPQRPGITSVK